MLYSTRLSTDDRFKKLSTGSILKRLNSFSNIFIVSAYYSNETINLFLQFNNKQKIQMVFSSITGSKEKKGLQLAELKNEFSSLKGKRNRKILLFHKFPLLHSKIYFGINKRIDGAICFVGSSNLSNNGFKINEEILIEVIDKETKDEIRDYINILTGKEYSYNIFSKKPFLNIEKDNLDFNRYISSGFLVYKPDVKVQLNFTNNELRCFANSINRNTQLEYAELESTISIKISEIAGIKKELEALDNELKDSTDDGGSSTVKANSVETCLGYWMPEEERMAIKPNLDKKKKKRKKIYETVVKKLENIIEKQTLIDDGLQKFVDSFVQNNSLKKNGDDFFDKLKIEVLEHIEKKLKGLKRDKERYIEGIFITPMPDIWEDIVTSKLFIDSFTADIEFKTNNKGISGVPLAKKILKNYRQSLNIDQ